MQYTLDAFFWSTDLMNWECLGILIISKYQGVFMIDDAECTVNSIKPVEVQ